MPLLLTWQIIYIVRNILKCLLFIQSEHCKERITILQMRNI